MANCRTNMISIQHFDGDFNRQFRLASANEPVFLRDWFHPDSWSCGRPSLINALRAFARVLFLLVFSSFLAGNLSVAAPAKWYLDMESGNPGDYMTARLLNPPGTHGSSSNWSTVSGSSDPTMYSMRVRATNDYPLLSSLAINGVIYTDNGSTRSFSSQNDRNNHYAVYRVPPLEAEAPSGQQWGQPKVSMGCYLRLQGLSGLSYGSYDLVVFHGGGQFAVLNLDDGTARAGEQYFRVHTRNGVGPGIRIYPEKTYWVTMVYDSTAGLYGTATLRVYDPVTLRLVGNESVLDHVGPDPGRQNVQEVRFGRCDVHEGGSITPGTFQYYDDLIVDESGCEWPLMPGGNPQGLRICSATQIGTNMDITWMGGRGPYQVQTRGSLNSGSWGNFGPPVTGNSAAIPVNKAGFLRVVGQ